MHTYIIHPQEQFSKSNAAINLSAENVAETLHRGHIHRQNQRDLFLCFVD